MFDALPFFGKSRRAQEYTTPGNFSQQEIRILQGHTGAVTHIVKYSASKIITGGEDGLLIMWDSKTGAKILDLGRHKSSISSLLVLDHLRILSGSVDGEIGIWALSTEKRAMFFGHFSSVTHLISLPNFHILGQKEDKQQERKLFCSGSDDAYLNVWDVSSGSRVLRITRLEGEGPLNSMIAISDSRIVCATNSPQLIVYDLGKGSSDHCRGHHQAVTQLLNLPGCLFVSSSLDGTALIWQAGPSEHVYALRVLVNLPTPIRSMHLLGKKYIGIPLPKGFEILHIDTGRVVQGVSRNPSAAAKTDVDGLIPLFGGQQVLTWGKDESELVLWESEKLKDFSSQTMERLPKKMEMDQSSTLYGHDGSVLCITPLDPISFATGGADGYVILWTDVRVATERTNGFAFQSLAYHHLKLRKPSGGSLGKKRGKGKKRELVWEDVQMHDEADATSVWEMVTSARTPTLSRFSSAALLEEHVGDSAHVNRRKLSDTSLRFTSSSSSLPPTFPSTPPLSSSASAGGRQSNRNSGNLGDDGVGYRRQKSYSTTTPNKQIMAQPAQRNPSATNLGESHAVAAILGEELYQALSHQQVCRLCNGTEEENMITTKTKEAVRLLREKNVSDGRIKEIFKTVLHHRQDFLVFLDVYLKEN